MKAIPINTQTLHEAIRLHQAGQIAQAEAIYRSILQQIPDHPTTCYLLATLLGDTGRIPAAIPLVRRAIEINPAVAEFHASLGEFSRLTGNLEDAIAAFRRALRLRPDFQPVVYRLGRALRESGQLDLAASTLEEAIRLNPTDADARDDLGIVRGAQFRKPEAIDHFRAAIALRPHDAAFHNNLGNVLLESKQLDLAREEFELALRIKPDFAEALLNKGVLLLRAEPKDLAGAKAALEVAVRLKPSLARAYQYLSTALAALEEVAPAIDAIEKAIALDPKLPDAHSEYGSLLHQVGRFEECLAAHRHAIKLDPSAGKWANLAIGFLNLNLPEDAIKCHEEAFRLNPDDGDMTFNLSMTELLMGRFESGWRHYEARFKKKEPTLRPTELKPEWCGEPLVGKTVYVYGEQGYGDHIHFIRYATLLAECGARVIAHAAPEIREMMASVPGIVEVVKDCQNPGEYDYHCSVMSMPAKFGTTLNTIPLNIPYMAAPAEKIELWKQKLGPRDGRLRVGLVWAGNPKQGADRIRSASLEAFAPLAQVPGVAYYSLQKGDAAVQAATPPDGMEVIDFTADIKSFSDTAGLIRNLDLVITVCTSTAHLAGAMGFPTWVMLSATACWRWMKKQDDSPWYPTMRLFRQAHVKNWTPVVSAVRDALKTTVTSNLQIAHPLPIIAKSSVPKHKLHIELAAQTSEPT